MTKDEELEDARQFTYNFNLEYMDIDGVDCPKIDSIAELALAYHRHRLETDVDGFNLSQITAKQSLDAARKSCQENKLPEPPKEK